MPTRSAAAFRTCFHNTADQDPFGRWHHFQEKHNQADVFHTAQFQQEIIGLHGPFH